MLARRESHLIVGDTVEKDPVSAQRRYEVLRDVLNEALKKERRDDGSASITTTDYEKVLIKPGMSEATIDVYATYGGQRVQFHVDARAGRTTLGGIPDPKLVDAIIDDIRTSAKSPPARVISAYSAMSANIGLADGSLNTLGPKRAERTEPIVAIFPDSQARNIEPKFLESMLVDWIKEDIRRLTFTDNGRRWLNTSYETIGQAIEESRKSNLSVAEVMERDRLSITANQFENQARMAPFSLDPATKLTLQRLSLHDPEKLREVFNGVFKPENFSEPTALAFALTRIAGVMHSLELDPKLCKQILPLGNDTPQWVASFSSQPNFGTEGIHRSFNAAAIQGSVSTAAGVTSLAMTTPLGNVLGFGQGSATSLGVIAAGCIGYGLVNLMKANSQSAQAQQQILNAPPMDAACLAVKRLFEN